MPFNHFSFSNLLFLTFALAARAPSSTHIECTAKSEKLIKICFYLICDAMRCDVSIVRWCVHSLSFLTHRLSIILFAIKIVLFAILFVVVVCMDGWMDEWSYVWHFIWLTVGKWNYAGDVSI